MAAVAAIKAICTPRFNLRAIQTTTNPVTPMIVFNGPIREQIGLNSSGNALGPGVRANATIGRTLRMIMLNVGGGVPGKIDMATQGQPGKYALCIGENEEHSPWESFSVEASYSPSDSVATAIPVTGTQNIHDVSTTAEGVLLTLSRHAATPGMHSVHAGGGPTFILSPEHAGLLASAGLTKGAVKRHLFENALLDESALSQQNLEFVRYRRPELFTGVGETKIRIADTPDLINIVVVGGPGTHSILLPGFGRASGISSQIVDGIRN
jgi:hypothetical protein